MADLMLIRKVVKIKWYCGKCDHLHVVDADVFQAKYGSLFDCTSKMIVCDECNFINTIENVQF